ncbi:hypothetical protein Pint_25323 [Pistacia integerrima]|uniref:Uncharacterized protein n=1 Tax=Pistacia integerrima TaxID=434235 RepID=A0ACC0YED3_9ROSI|nr:hypothetical protein Pint_25323 [Pistacia integerrima]
MWVSCFKVVSSHLTEESIITLKSSYNETLLEMLVSYSIIDTLHCATQ